MNRLLYFATGTLGTLTMSSTLSPDDCGSFIVTQAVSILSGVLSAVTVAWIERILKKRRK